MGNSTDLISHNVYFDGKVQSLGLATTDGKATVGVMKAGTYQFSTSSPEKMVIVAGIMKVCLGDNNWKDYAANEHFNVAAGSKFDIVCDSDVAYICYYG